VNIKGLDYLPYVASCLNPMKKGTYRHKAEDIPKSDKKQ
jgi:hypothetical protein